MNVSGLFEEIAKIKNENNKCKDRISRKDNIVEVYKQMMLSDYRINQENLLEIEGIVDFFYDKKEVKDIELNKSTYNYLVYEMVGHNGEWRIIEFNNLKDVEEYILSPGGILNMFVSEIIVLENLKNKKYKVYEILQNGEEKEVFGFEDCTPDIEPNLIVRWC